MASNNEDKLSYEEIQSITKKYGFNSVNFNYDLENLIESPDYNASSEEKNTPEFVKFDGTRIKLPETAKTSSYESGKDAETRALEKVLQTGINLNLKFVEVCTVDHVVTVQRLGAYTPENIDPARLEYVGVAAVVFYSES